MVLDGLLVVAKGVVGVADVPVGTAHTGPVAEAPGDAEMGLVELESGVVVAQHVIDDAEVATGTALGHFVLRRQGHVQLALVPHLRRLQVAYRA